GDGLDVEAVVGKGLLEGGHGVGRRLQQKEPEAYHVRIQLQEVLLRHQQLALKDAVVKRVHNPETGVVQDEDLARLQVENVCQGVRFRDCRDYTIRGCRHQQGPGVERRERSKNARILRPVEIQATGIVAGTEAERNDVHSRQRWDIEGFAARRRGWIVN